MIVETSSAHPSTLGERNLALMLQRTKTQWGGDKDLWVFGYASLIWRPEFDFAERRPARVHGWHRALRMWSHVNRGTEECPGLVFAMLSGGSCQGMVFRIPQRDAQAALERLWVREMPTPVYDPRWLPCQTDQGPVQALTFTLSRRSPSHTGALAAHDYQRIFRHANGRYGSTRDYAHDTYHGLRAVGIHDRALGRLLELSRSDGAPGQESVAGSWCNGLEKG